MIQNSDTHLCSPLASLQSVGRAMHQQSSTADDKAGGRGRGPPT